MVKTIKYLLLLYVLCFTLIAKCESSANQCVLIFSDQSKKSDLKTEPKRKTLKESKTSQKIVLSTNFEHFPVEKYFKSKKIKRYFEEKVKEFLRKLRKFKFEDYIDKLSDKKSIVLKKNEMDYFSKVRVGAQTLRGLYEVFNDSNSHQSLTNQKSPSDTYDKLVKYWGDIKDQFFRLSKLKDKEEKKQEKQIIKKIVAAAKKIRKILRDHFNFKDFFDSFSPLTEKEIHNNLQSIREKVSRVLFFLKSGKISAHRYHQLRKSFKKYYWVVRYLNALKNIPSRSKVEDINMNFEELEKKLEKIVGHLGKQHTLFVAEREKYPQRSKKYMRYWNLQDKTVDPAILKEIEEVLPVLDLVFHLQPQP